MFGRRSPPPTARSSDSTSSPSGAEGRRDDGDGAGPGTDREVGAAIGYDAGKGRPTPKRRDAEKGRRRAVTAPRDRMEAARAARARQREDRTRQMQALRAGDERHLPPRDRGPARRYVRDLVDARRSVAEFFLPLALLILVLSLGPERLKLFSGSLWLALVVLVVLDSAVLVWRVRRGLARSLPDEPHRGALPYALMRSMQIRRFRLPPPRLRRRGVRRRRTRQG